MIISIYLTATGEIVRVTSVDDDIDPADLADMIPVGGDYAEEMANPNTEYYLSDVKTARPVLTDEKMFNIDADGVDSVTFPVPSGTIITNNGIYGPDTTTAGEDFEFSSAVKGAFEFVLEPPFPYVVASFWVFAGEVASRSYGSVTTEDVAAGAISPSRLTAGAGGDNLCQDYDLLEVENFTFTSYLISAGSGTEAPLGPAFVGQIPNPTSGGRGNSNYLFHVRAPAAEHVVRVETARDSVVEEGKEYSLAGWYEPAAASFPDVEWYVRWWSIDTDGDLAHISDVKINGTANSILYGMTATATAPAGAVRCSLLLHVKTETGETSDFYYASPAIRPLINRQDISAWAYDFQDANTGSFGTSKRILAEAEFPDGFARVPMFVAISASFVNDSGAAKTFSIEVEQNNGSALTTVWQEDVTVGNGALFNLNCHQPFPPTEGSVSYNLNVTGAAGSNNLKKCRIFADARMA
jgi:hypothetical protein